jgi:hypothetical protein
MEESFDIAETSGQLRAAGSEDILAGKLLVHRDVDGAWNRILVTDVSGLGKTFCSAFQRDESSPFRQN